MGDRSAPLVRVLEDFAARGGRVVLHHHDLPWQLDVADRAHERELPRVTSAVHVGISLRARRDMQARGYTPAVTIHEHYDFDAPPGDREATRARLGFRDEEILLYQPTGATRNTNVAGAIRFLRALDGVVKNRPMRFWLRGPIDDDVAPTIERLLEHCPIPLTIGA